MFLANNVAALRPSSQINHFALVMLIMVKMMLGLQVVTNTPPEKKRKHGIVYNTSLSSTHGHYEAGALFVVYTQVRNMNSMHLDMIYRFCT